VTLGPLEGFTVGITAERRWEEQASLLRRRGAAIVHGPSITTSLSCDDTLRATTRSLVDHPPRYLVATTGMGFRAWLEAAQTWGVDADLLAALASCRVVARGAKAAAAVQSAGLAVWARAANEQMSDVIGILAGEPLAGVRVAVQRYGMDDPVLGSFLAGAGAEVAEVPVYLWRLPDDEEPALRLVRGVVEGRVQAVTFTAAPAARNLFVLAARHGLEGPLLQAFNRDGVVAACVGPVCAGGALEAGIADPLVPPMGRLGLLVRALSDHLEGQRQVLRLAGTEVVLQGTTALVEGRAVRLSPRERSLLEALVEAGGAVVSQAALLRAVWGEPATDPHVVEVTVGRLRRRLGPAGAALCTTPRRGYRVEAGTAPADRAG